MKIFIEVFEKEFSNFADKVIPKLMQKLQCSKVSKVKDRSALKSILEPEIKKGSKAIINIANEVMK